MACFRKHTDELLGDHILSEIPMYVVFVSGRVGGPITAAIDVPVSLKFAHTPILFT